MSFPGDADVAAFSSATAGNGSAPVNGLLFDVKVSNTRSPRQSELLIPKMSFHGDADGAAFSAATADNGPTPVNGL